MGLLTAYFSLMGVSDATYKRIDCNLSAISMDANNVQKLPAVFTLMDTYGATVGTFAAYLRLQIMNREAVLDTISYSSLQSSLTYTVPANKYGIATGIKLTAYEDTAFTKEICHTSVSIVRENPTPFPRSENWSADLTYKNGEYLMQDNVVYMWMNPIAGNSTVDPMTDIQQHPDTTSWKSYQEWPLLASQVFLSKWAKLGSSIFDGDYTFSQHGKDAGGNDTDDYRQFDPTKIGQSDCPFTPNLMIDWLLGKLIGLDMDVKGGKIANFQIVEKALRNIPGQKASIGVDYTKTVDGKNTHFRSILGYESPILPDETTGTAAWFEATGANSNVAVRLHAEGSTTVLDSKNNNGKFANLAIVATGGCNWGCMATDFWCMPGFLTECEFTNGGRLGSNWLYNLNEGSQFGNGLLVTEKRMTVLNGNSGDSSYRLYRVYHNLGHTQYSFHVEPFGKRESGNWSGCWSCYLERDADHIGFRFYEGNGSPVLVDRFMVTFYGRPSIYG